MSKAADYFDLDDDDFQNFEKIKRGRKRVEEEQKTEKKRESVKHQKSH